jgi:ribosomal protein L11
MRRYFRFSFLLKSYLSVNRIKILYILNLYLPAQKLVSDPNLTQILGQYSLLSSDFCKIFNQQSIIFKLGILVPTFIYIYDNKKYEIFFSIPHISFFIKFLLNFNYCNLGSLSYRLKFFFIKYNSRLNIKKKKRFKFKKGFIFLKQIYEILKYRYFYFYSYFTTNLYSYFKSLLGSIHSMGIRVIFKFII